MGEEYRDTVYINSKGIDKNTNWKATANELHDRDYIICFYRNNEERFIVFETMIIRNKIGQDEYWRSMNCGKKTIKEYNWR